MRRIVPSIISDVFIAGIALFGGYYLRYNLDIPPNLESVLLYVAVFCVISAFIFFLVGVHRGVWRFASLSDLRGRLETGLWGGWSGSDVIPNGCRSLWSLSCGRRPPGGSIAAITCATEAI
jgi:hypothetical protein